MAEPGTPNKKSVKTATPTRYLVLKQKGPDLGWEILNSNVVASSAEQAIRSAALIMAPDQSGVYVAVPARSWKPTKVAPKTMVQLELTEVKP